MKKFTKLFLLALCTWFLFLWFNFAQNQQASHENDLFTDDSNSNINSEFNSWFNNAQYSWYYIEWIQKISCIIPSIGRFSYWFLKLTLLILIFLSLCSIPLYKKFKNIDKNNRFFCVPLLNIYPLFRITMGKIRLYCVMVYLLFLVYLNYKYDYCDDNETIMRLIFYLGLFSIIILLILWIELISLYKWNSNKKSPNK